MPVEKYKPTSPGRRDMSVSTFTEITRSKPEKSLLRPLSKHGGRNNQGRITQRHQAAATSAGTASSTSSATNSVCRPG